MDELNRKIKIKSKTKATTQDLLRRKCQHAIRSCSIILTITNLLELHSFKFYLFDWGFTSYSRIFQPLPPFERFSTEPPQRFFKFWPYEQISNISVFTVCIRRRIYGKKRLHTWSCVCHRLNKLIITFGTAFSSISIFDLFRRSSLLTATVSCKMGSSSESSYLL